MLWDGEQNVFNLFKINDYPLTTVHVLVNYRLKHWLMSSSVYTNAHRQTAACRVVPADFAACCGCGRHGHRPDQRRLCFLIETTCIEVQTPSGRARRKTMPRWRKIRETLTTDTGTTSCQY